MALILCVMWIISSGRQAQLSPVCEDVCRVNHGSCAVTTKDSWRK